MNRTTDYDEAISWARKLGLEGITPTVWIPKKGFSHAISNDDGSVSFTRKDSPTFGLGVGPNPVIDEAWDFFALPKSLPKEKTLEFKLINRWNPYQISTRSFTNLHNAKVISEEGLKDFLDANAPESSVYPGNEETIFWAGILKDDELVAIGCVNRWESGEFVISSIATKKSERKKGYGTDITKGILALCNERGIERVSLAVNAKNEVAARVYEKIGFENLGKFNTFQRVD